MTILLNEGLEMKVQSSDVIYLCFHEAKLWDKGISALFTWSLGAGQVWASVLLALRVGIMKPVGVPQTRAVWHDG